MGGVYGNQAAWLKEPKAHLVVEAGPEPKAGAGEVVIKNAFLAINPVDWKIQAYAPPAQRYPDVLGRDIAGEIVEVGEGVTRLKVGQRVIASVITFGNFEKKVLICLTGMHSDERLAIPSMAVSNFTPLARKSPLPLFQILCRMRMQSSCH
jgi:NADPH:quinone reductase-like Zn-dependent oxidoreductase